MNPLISVIIPIYNVEPYLRRCINSVLNQTYNNLEIILVDDGSPDNCGIICDEYAKNHDRIKVIHKRNGGLSDARNAGLNIASGKYIGFIDSDDWVSNIYLQKLYDLISNHNSDISVCNFVKAYDEKDLLSNNHCIELYEYNNIEALNQYFNKYYIQMVVSWGKLYKTALFKDIGFPVGRIHEDEFTTHKLLYKANKVVFTTESLYYYWQRQDSITGVGFNLKGRLHRLEALKERCEFYKHSGLEVLWKNALRIYFYEIIYIYGSINCKENKSTIFELKIKANEIKETILNNDFSFRFRVLYLMFINASRTTILIEKVFNKHGLCLKQHKKSIVQNKW
ncbi:MAG: glycosyltransferase family 2 protein [Clostridiaceae bacterium]